MKVYRVIKPGKAGNFSLDDAASATRPVEVRLKHKHKLKWNPQKMLKKLWSAWL